MTRFALALALAAVLGMGVVWWAARGNGNTPSAAGLNLDALAAAAMAQAKPADRPASLPSPDPPYHGMSWQVHNARYAVDEAKLLLPQIAELGADAVLISTFAHQEHARSETFELTPDVSPTRSQWREILQIAHEQRLRVILMPIILLSNPRGTEWRGVIEPPDWDDWFERYVKFIVHFAGIAAENHVEVFAVGSEYVSSESFTDRWRRVIREVRKVYPGRLTYSANWDHYKVVEFWDQLDLVGMTSYYKLSSEPNPTMKTLMDEWAPIKRGILKWQQTIKKPLLFTEAAWCSQEGTSIEPWNYYYKQVATAAGLEEQRRCYRAFMDTWKDTPQVGGVIWWEWMNVPGGPDDYNYTPKGKPAEKELRAWFKAVQEKRAAASAPGGASPR